MNIMERDFSKQIFLSITGINNLDWQEKLKDIDSLGIEEVAVFLTRFDKKERQHLYKFLLKSRIKKIPLVHLRDDTDYEDIEFFIKNFNTEYFNIHEDHFNLIDRWRGYFDKLYLELNIDNKIAKNIEIEKIGGFCVDLAHFKASIARGEEEAVKVFFEKDKVMFGCNHLSGYDELNKSDVHFVTDLKQFDYLATLPKFVFSNIIAIEVDNGIKEQVEFKKYIISILNNI